MDKYMESTNIVANTIWSKQREAIISGYIIPNYLIGVCLFLWQGIYWVEWATILNLVVLKIRSSFRDSSETHKLVKNIMN